MRYYGVLSDLHDCGGGIRAAAARNGTTYLDQPFVVGSDRFSGDFTAGVIATSIVAVPRGWCGSYACRSVNVSPWTSVTLRLDHLSGKRA